jgi:hypothetical protein
MEKRGETPASFIKMIIVKGRSFLDNTIII